MAIPSLRDSEIIIRELLDNEYFFELETLPRTVFGPPPCPCLLSFVSVI